MQGARRHFCKGMQAQTVPHKEKKGPTHRNKKPHVKKGLSRGEKRPHTWGQAPALAPMTRDVVDYNNMCLRSHQYMIDESIKFNTCLIIIVKESNYFFMSVV